MSIPKDDVQDTLEEGPTRYAAFAMRLRTLITASSRYIAYSSDIGEAFRPLTNPTFVRAAYGISWTYILGDVGYAGYRAHIDRKSLSSGVFDSLTPVQKVELKRRQETLAKEGLGPSHTSEHMHVGLIMARRAVFQSIASMALPAFTIHSIVRYSAPIFAKSSRPRIRASGPTVAGLAFVPALPYLFDEPVEHVIDRAFDWIECKMGQTDKVEAASKMKTEGGDTEIGMKMAGEAAIVGIGVDAVYLPRLVTLLTRHGKRLAASGRQSTMPALALAAQQFAKRVLHCREYEEWRRNLSKEPDVTAVRNISWLSARWAVKEAAFKALPNDRLRLSWHDAFLTKVNGRPSLCHTDEVKRRWQQAGLGCLLPTLHVSITHDNDYLTAFVVAESAPASSTNISKAEQGMV